MSSNTDTGGPAFPVPGLHENNDYDGMTLRDYFAAKAMQGMMADGQVLRLVEDGDLAGAAYAMADAMLKARKA
jgi:hypothetical protein